MAAHPPWKPGESGNPAGRPKGARHKLAESFIKALATDFAANGAAAIIAARIVDPGQYLNTIARVLPKVLEGDEEGGPVIVTIRWAASPPLIEATPEPDAQETQ